MDKEQAMPRWNAIRQDLTPYLLVFVGIFLVLSLFSFSEGDDGSGSNWFGRIGYYASFTLFYLLGKSAFLLALFSLVLGVISFKNPDFDRLGKALFFPLFLIATSVSLNIFETPLGQLGDGGGALGLFFSWVLSYLFGDTGRSIVVFFLLIYSAIIWLEDKTWGFTFGTMNEWSNCIYRKLGGKRDLSHLKLPSFLNEWIELEKVGLDIGSAQVAEKKSWFEKKTAGEILDNHYEPMQEAEPISFLMDRHIEKKSIPRLRYKNTSLYEGFFEESGKIFRFHKASVSLADKLSSRTELHSAYSMQLLDFRRTGMRAEPLREMVDNGREHMFPQIHASSSLNQPVSSIGLEDLVLFKTTNLLDEESDLEASIDTDNLIGEEDDTVDLSLSQQGDWEQDVIEEDREEGITEIDSLPIPDEEVILPTNVFAIESLKFKSMKADEKKKYPVGSLVPIPKLKVGKYYISHKLLADHKPTVAFFAKYDSELETVGKKIEEIIGYYGIESKVVGKERGPIITRYELTIPHGVKLNKITTLADELKLHLAVKSIRIVAPIPGKSSIGIEVPNIHREDVFLSEILKEQILHNTAKGLSISIGKDISGKIVTIDLAKLPHLLIAGTTGSGKSVSLNSMITSLICTRSPEEVRFIMIDPKMVEMTLYEDIPHLIMPVITDPKKATKALSWAIQEMEARYQIVSQLKSRDFKSYNDKVEEYAHKNGYQKFPYIVIFIDELSDLMMVSGKELEDQITRISQKSRAVGIHLVMATQRPSVDVITGLIKANCPARVAFQVAQKTDSRTILDISGAESLLGKGDFLYKSPTSSDLLRIQAPFIEEKEIEAIVEEAKKQGSPTYVDMNWDEESSMESVSDEDEELFEDAWNIVLMEKKASASYLQRRMRIGYNKAARLMELMEMRGYVSAQVGAKPREILRSA